MGNLNNKLVAAAALAIILIFSWKVYAAAPKPPKSQIWTPGCVATVPRSWGTFRGASAQSGLAFEDSNGTLRFVTNIPCDGTPIVSLEIRRPVANATNNGNQ
jgi:hypothetical protein